MGRQSEQRSYQLEDEDDIKFHLGNEDKSTYSMREILGIRIRYVSSYVIYSFLNIT